MFNEDDALIMIIATVSKELVAPILEGLAPFYNENSGLVFVSDIEVTRVVKLTDESESQEYSESTSDLGFQFTPEVEGKEDPSDEK